MFIIIGKTKGFTCKRQLSDAPCTAPVFTAEEALFLQKAVKVQHNFKYD